MYPMLSRPACQMRGDIDLVYSAVWNQSIECRVSASCLSSLGKCSFMFCQSLLPDYNTFASSASLNDVMNDYM